MREKQRVALVALLTALAIIATFPSGRAVAQAPTAPGSGAAADPALTPLRERVLAYWQARVQKNYRAEFDLLEPRARAVLDPEEYGRGRAVDYLAVQVEDVERRGNFARVGVRLLVRVHIPAVVPRTVGMSRTESTLLHDVWVRVDGTWYRTREADAGTSAPWPAVDE